MFSQFYVVYRAAELDYVGKSVAEFVPQVPVLSTCEPFETFEAARSWVMQHGSGGAVYLILQAFANRQEEP